jgi:hypothetical protein
VSKGVTFTFSENTEGWKKIKKVLSEIALKRPYAKVGVLDNGGGAEVRESGYTTAQIAAVHEFGAPNAGIPERSFMRSTFNEQYTELVGISRVLTLKIYLSQLTPQEALNILGAKLAADMKKKITAGPEVPPPNSPETIARKQAKGLGQTRTLVDTGRMVDSITWVVVSSDTGND